MFEFGARAGHLNVFLEWLCTESHGLQVLNKRNAGGSPLTEESAVLQDAFWTNTQKEPAPLNLCVGPLKDQMAKRYNDRSSAH